MQLSLFYDYQGILDSSSFHRKYDALFQAFDLFFTGPEYSEFGRKGYPDSSCLKALIFKQSEKIKYVSDLLRSLDHDERLHSLQFARRIQFLPIPFPDEKLRARGTRPQRLEAPD